VRTRFHAPGDSNDASILCFPGRNGKNIPRSGPLESVFTDCGWNREVACLLAGVEPAYREFKGTPLEAAALSWSYNKPRRHLTHSQKAAVAVESADVIAAEEKAAKGRRLAGNARGGKGKSVEPLPPTSGGKSRDKVGEIFGVSGRTVSDAKAIKKISPKLFEQVKSGEKTITQVKRELQERKRESRRRDGRSRLEKTTVAAKRLRKSCLNLLAACRKARSRRSFIAQTSTAAISRRPRRRNTGSG
jgi:hypothetical protein